MGFRIFFFLLSFLSLSLFGSVRNWNKWDYIGYPNKFASPTVSMYMGDSPAANFEMGPFGRGPFVMYY